MRAARAAAALLLLLALAGCKRGEAVWDTTPIPTDAPVTVTVPPPAP